MAVLVLLVLSWAWMMDPSPDAIRPCLPAGDVHRQDVQVSQKETVLARDRLILSRGMGSRLLWIFSDGWSPSQVEKPHQSCSSKVS